jgi:hypothetical protein
MPQSAKLENDVSLETSIPEGGDTLESILCTEELYRRPWRPPDYEKENCALVKLVSALADSPGMGLGESAVFPKLLCYRVRILRGRGPEIPPLRKKRARMGHPIAFLAAKKSKSKAADRSVLSTLPHQRRLISEAT